MAGSHYCEEFGRLFKQHRLRLRMTLREFCRKHGLDHGNVSKLERGRLKPPTGESLDAYAEYLGLRRGSEEWQEFHNVAAACAGEVPDELMRDEDVVKKLPVVFRTLSRDKPTEEELRQLIELIRRA